MLSGILLPYKLSTQYQNYVADVTRSFSLLQVKKRLKGVVPMKLWETTRQHYRTYFS